MKEVKIRDLTFEISISSDEISSRIGVLAAQIAEKYKDQCPIFIGILDGCFVFMSDFIRACAITCDVEFVKLKSYEGTKSSEIRELLSLTIDVTGRPVIILEDIIDTGKTIAYFKNYLSQLDPKSIEVVSLLFKPEALQNDEVPEFIGFSIPSDFVVGYGLDYDGQGRELSSIYKLKAKKGQ